MTYATDTFTGDGSTVEFTLTFDFIQRDHVKVYRVVTATQAETELVVITSGTPTGNQFIWESDTQVKVGTAPTSAQELKIVRETPEDEQIVEWADGSYIIAQDLNTADRQFLYGIQELEDKVEALDGGSTGGAAVKGVTGTAPITVDNADPQNPIIGSDAVTEITGTAPVSVDSGDAQKPAISVDTIKKADAESDPTDPSWDTDDKLPTAAAVDRVYKQVVGDGVGFPGSGNKAKDGQLRVDNTGDEPDLYYWDASLGTPAWVEIAQTGKQGPKGDTGPAGPAPGLQDPAASASNVSLNSDGSLGTATATVSQDGDKNLKFEFGIPVGQRGLKGDTGSGVTYKGLIDATTADEPTDPQGGDFYLSTVAGTSSWAGTVGVGTRIIYNGETSDWDTIDPEASQTLQAVCDLGNFTTTDVAIGNESSDPRIELKGSDGSITAEGNATIDGNVASAANPEDSSTTNGAMLDKNKVVARNASGQSVWLGYKNGTADSTSAITADGTIRSGGNPGAGANTGAELRATGEFVVKANSESSEVFVAYPSDSTDKSISLTGAGAATFEGRLEANQGSFNADVGIIGESGTDTAFFIRDAGDSDKTTFSVQADGDVETEGDITAAGSITAAGGATFEDDTTVKANLLIKGGDGSGVFIRNKEDTEYTIDLKEDGSATFAGMVTAAGTDSATVFRVEQNNVAGTYKTELKADGSATFGVRDTSSTTATGIDINATGSVYIQGSGTTGNGATVFQYSRGTDDATFKVLAGGSVTAAGSVTAGTGGRVKIGPTAGLICDPVQDRGIVIGSDSIQATDADGVSSDGEVDLGSSSKRFKRGYFSGNISTESDINLDGNLYAGGEPASGSENGTRLSPDGVVYASRTSSGPCFLAFKTGDSTAKAAINNDGRVELKDIEFADGTVQTTAATGGGASGSVYGWVTFESNGTVKNSSTSISAVTKTGGNSYRIDFADNIGADNYAWVSQCSKGGNYMVKATAGSLNADNYSMSYNNDSNSPVTPSTPVMHIIAHNP